jgi:hypothetical protein
MPSERALLFLEEDVATAVQALEAFQQTARTRANLLTDAQGQVFAQHGSASLPPETISALVAASVAATKGIREISPPDELVSLTHEGKDASLQVTHGAAGTILVTVFDAKSTTTGALIFYLREVMEKLNALVKTVASREAKPVDLGENFDGAAKGALDDMFGKSQETDGG